MFFFKVSAVVALMASTLVLPALGQTSNANGSNANTNDAGQKPNAPYTNADLHKSW